MTTEEADAQIPAVIGVQPVAGTINGQPTPTFLGTGVFAGLSNQRMQLFALAQIARENNATIALGTLQWRESWKSPDLVSHEVLWDVNHWNKIAQLYANSAHLLRLPRLADYAEWQVTLRLTSRSLWNRYAAYHDYLISDPKRVPFRDPLEVVFEAALRPHPRIQVVIDMISKQFRPLGVLHPRIEEDLKMVKSLYVERTTIAVLYALMRNASGELRRCMNSGERPDCSQAPATQVGSSGASRCHPTGSLLLAVAKEDVARPEDADILAKRSTPWPSTSLVLAGVLTARHYGFEHPFITGAMIDFELSTNAHFYIGTSSSTFANSVVHARTLNRQDRCSFQFTPDASSLGLRTDDGRLFSGWSRPSGLMIGRDRYPYPLIPSAIQDYHPRIPNFTRFWSGWNQSLLEVLHADALKAFQHMPT